MINRVPQLNCVHLGRINATWGQIFPIEAYDFVKDKASKAHGFDKDEEVTVDKLRMKILQLI